MTGPSRIALTTIALLAAINLGRGAIHVFAPDGGAHSIAGLAIEGAPQTIIFLLASVGVGQIGLGLIDAFAALRRRDFVRPLLVVHVIQTGLGVFSLFVLKPPPTEVPGQWFNLALLVAILGVAAYEFAWRRGETV